MKVKKPKTSERYRSKGIKKSLWERIYEKGTKTARDFKIKSEKDIDKILHQD